MKQTQCKNQTEDRKLRTVTAVSYEKMVRKVISFGLISVLDDKMFQYPLLTSQPAYKRFLFPLSLFFKGNWKRPCTLATAIDFMSLLLVMNR